ncbi:DUF4245 domain-containing protein [Spiractinospora alimapuensis]|uniref:DUF4245 domain-containing protein n=1 Tax=Spiractinospora alimapuensis TaxID=2820884 RepID=UPI001F4136F1|nr:DUF4245 domain-containing protein [Spiractinospora alimapuensis]QVQ51461.1 DUF4245 domain-containing protein [Spiractinospora alimapuensis]
MTTETDDAPAQTAAPATPEKKPRSRNDVFANYLVVLLAFAGISLVIVLFASWGEEESLPEVDYEADAEQFTAFAPFPVLAPEDLPDDWVATSSRLTLAGATAGEEITDPVKWDVGFVTSSEEYASLRIGDDDPEDFIADMTNDGDPDGDQQVADDTWDRYETPDGDRRSLVRPTEGATLVVTGTATYDELATLAESLEPQE